MALFSIGGKKNNSKQTAAPVAQVVTMKQQGYDDNQIMQSLQSQGYSNEEIANAMSQAGLGNPPQMPPDQAAQQPMPPPDMAQPPQDQAQYQYPEQQPPPAPEPFQQEPADKEKIEEVAEAIIDEKWKDVMKDINKIVEWNSKAESRLVRIEQDIQNLKQNFESLHKGILGKITEYDQHLVNVGTEIKAMEKVFQKVLPTFTENVNKLAKLTGNLPSAPLKKK